LLSRKRQWRSDEVQRKTRGKQPSAHRLFLLLLKPWRMSGRLSTGRPVDWEGDCACKAEVEGGLLTDIGVVPQQRASGLLPSKTFPYAIAERVKAGYCRFVSEPCRWQTQCRRKRLLWPGKNPASGGVARPIPDSGLSYAVPVNTSLIFSPNAFIVNGFCMKD
jgi:hypothetical protein